MNNETLSQKQVKQIVSQYDTIINSTVKKIEAGFDNFFNTMKNEWEDNNAVTFSGQVRDAMSEVTTNLNQNCNSFANAVKAIATMYAGTGNMGAISLPTMVSKKMTLPTERIKETFDGDIFGFKNVSSHDNISKELNKLVSSLNRIIDEANTQIKGINAFGNSKVTNNLSISGGKIVEILNEKVKAVEKFANDNISATAKAYQKTGQSAETTAEMQVKQG